MLRKVSYQLLASALLLAVIPEALAWSSSSNSRRDWLKQTAAGILTASPVSAAWAAVDCFQDCQKNCRLIAPKDPAYCNQNCRDYCDQPDRTGKFYSL